jgi:hypothetical protein
MLRLLEGNFLSFLLARLKSFTIYCLCHNQMDGAQLIQNLFDVFWNCCRKRTTMMVGVHLIQHGETMMISTNFSGSNSCLIFLPLHFDTFLSFAYVFSIAGHVTALMSLVGHGI